MKTCANCKEEKTFNEFGLNKRKKDGHSPVCKSCRSSYEKKRYELNLTEERERARKRYSDNPKKELERLKKYRSTIKESTKNWEKNNRDHRRKYLNEYSKMRKKKDPVFKLMNNMRIRINKFLSSKNLTKSSKTSKILGITGSQLKEHLEKQFSIGMSWDNYGLWHIDHIIPLSSCNTIDEVNQLCHYTNLQPLWANDNFVKGGMKKL